MQWSLLEGSHPEEHVLVLLRKGAIRLCRLKSVSLHPLIEVRQAVDTY